MKILIASDLFPPYASGVSTVAFNLATGLTKSGHQVVVLTSGDSLKGKVENQGGLKIVRLPSLLVPFRKETRFSLPVILEVMRILKKESPEVVHIHTFFGVGVPTFIAAKRLQVPIVATNHILPGNVAGFLPLGERFEGLIEKELWAYNRFFYQRCDFITAPTEIALNVVKRYVKLKNCAAVSNGIDLSKFGKRQYSREEARKKLGLSNTPLILFTGRLQKEKRADFLIKSFRKVREKVAANLVIVGTGSEEPLLKGLIKKLGLEGSVRMAGFVSDQELKDYYQAADVFTMPSKVELQGLVCLEAATYGVPIVGSRSVALPELIKDDENGYLFEPESQTDLAEKLLKILGDKKLREKLGRGAVETAHQHDLPQTIKKYEAIYRECLEKAQSAKIKM